MPEPTRYWPRHSGKVAIVTGAGAEGEKIGVGRATATVLAAEGARVCCADLDLQRAQDTVERIVGAGGEAFAAVGDVSRAADCERLVQETLRRYGRLDILVNNVGISPVVRLGEFDEGLWSRVVDVNLKSAVLMSLAAAPAMHASAGGGAIVNISSIAGRLAYRALAYGPAKAGMAQLSRELALECGHLNVRANTVAPGHIMTSHVDYKISSATRERRRRAGPLGVEGDGWDIAMAVSFLASEEARFINGVELPVDGGVTAVGSTAAYELMTRE